MQETLSHTEQQITVSYASTGSQMEHPSVVNLTGSDCCSILVIITLVMHFFVHHTTVSFCSSRLAYCIFYLCIIYLVIVLSHHPEWNMSQQVQLPRFHFQQLDTESETVRNIMFSLLCSWYSPNCHSPSICEVAECSFEIVSDLSCVLYWTDHL